MIKRTSLVFDKRIIERNALPGSVAVFRAAQLYADVLAYGLCPSAVLRSQKTDKYESRDGIAIFKDVGYANSVLQTAMAKCVRMSAEIGVIDESCSVFLKIFFYKLGNKKDSVSFQFNFSLGSGELRTQSVATTINDLSSL